MTHTHTHRDIHTLTIVSLTHTCHCHWHPPVYRSWLVHLHDLIPFPSLPTINNYWYNRCIDKHPKLINCYSVDSQSHYQLGTLRDTLTVRLSNRFKRWVVSMLLFVFTRIPVIDSRTNIRLSTKSTIHRECWHSESGCPSNNLSGGTTTVKRWWHTLLLLHPQHSHKSFDKKPRN